MILELIRKKQNDSQRQSFRKIKQITLYTCLYVPSKKNIEILDGVDGPEICTNAYIIT